MTELKKWHDIPTETNAAVSLETTDDPTADLISAFGACAIKQMLMPHIDRYHQGIDGKHPIITSENAKITFLSALLADLTAAGATPKDINDLGKNHGHLSDEEAATKADGRFVQAFGDLVWRGEFAAARRRAEQLLSSDVSPEV